MLDEKVKEIYNNPKEALKRVIGFYNLIKENYVSLSLLERLDDFSNYKFRLIIISDTSTSSSNISTLKKFNGKLVKITKEYSPHFKGPVLSMFDVVDSKLEYTFGLRDYGKKFLLKREYD